MRLPRILPFLIVTYKIPIRLGPGILRVGIGAIVRIGPRAWAALALSLLLLMSVWMTIPIILYLGQLAKAF